MFNSRKFYIPKNDTPKVERKRLNSLLSSLENKKLGIISAPAGYGKSTLLSEFIEDKNSLWYNLDRDDDDLYKFWTNIIKLLSNFITIDYKDLLNDLESHGNPENSIEEICKNLTDKVIYLVIDDYHNVENRDIGLWLRRFINKVPTNLKVIISSREGVNFPLSRFRLNSTILEITSKDLRFNSNEIKDFIYKLTQKTLNEEEISIINKRTEGWVAILQLAVLAWSNRGFNNSITEDVNENNVYIMDYLLEEIIENLPREYRDFLINISVLTEFNIDACDYLCGVNTRYLLDKAIKDNLFIYSLDSNSKWYRFHHLFRELLLKRLEYDNEKRRELYIKGIGWYKENSFLKNGYTLTQELGNLPIKIDYLEEVSLNYMGIGHTGTVMRWLESVPEKSLIQSPWLSISYAFCLSVTKNPEDSLLKIERWLDIAENLSEVIIDIYERKRILGYVWSIRAYANHTSYNKNYDATLVIEQANKALENLPADDYSMISLNHQSLFNAYCNLLDLRRAKEELDKALSIGVNGKFYYIDMTNGFYEAYYYYIIGNQKEAYRVINRHIDYWLSRGVHKENPAIGILYMQKGLILQSMGEMIEAEKVLTTSKKIVIHTGRSLAISLIHWGLLFIYTFENRRDEAYRELMSFEKYWHGDSWIISYMKSRIEMKSYTPLNINFKSGVDLSNLPVFLTSLGIILTNSNIDEYLAIYKDTGLLGVVHYLKLTKESFSNNPDLGIAREVVDEILTSQNTSILYFPALEPLLTKLYQNGLKELKPFLPEGSNLNPFNLTEREIEVLKLMALGHTNKEIGEKLFLSPNTIRTHTVNIYDKMGLRTRTEVVREYLCTIEEA